MNSEGAFIAYPEELEVIKLGIIFSDRVNSVGFNFKHLQNYVKIVDFKDKDYTEAYKIFVSAQPGALSETDIDNFYSRLMSLRNSKNKPKHDLIFYAKLENILKNIKIDVVNYMQNYVVHYKMEFLPEFIKRNELVIHHYESLIEKDRVIFLNMMIEKFSSPDLYHIFDHGVFKRKDNETDDKEVMTDPNNCYSTPLFNFPNIDTLNSSQLNILRKDFHDNLGKFYGAVAEMRKEFDDVILTPDNMKDINKRLDDFIEPHLPDVNSIAGSNIYFELIRNSTKSAGEKRFNIGIGKIRTVVGMYRNRMVITVSEEEYVLEKIAKYKNPDSCCVFFFVELGPDSVDIYGLS
jgi:hypothetical protein